MCPDSRSALTTTARGRHAEEIAARWLALQGFELLDRNRRAADGEIDLVARDGATLVFVEVRLRRSGSRQRAAGSIDRRKWQRLRHCAAALAREPGFQWPGRRLRLDAVLMEYDGERMRLQHLRNLTGPAA